MNLGLQDKLVFITGSTEGIGLEIARQFLHQGSRVIINGRSQDKINKALAQLNKNKPATAKHDVKAIAADLGTADGANLVIKKIDELGELDVLVCNLGIFQVKAFEEADDDMWNSHWNVNVMHVVRLARHFLPRMLKRCSAKKSMESKEADEPPFARILLMSSETGVRPLTQFLHYSLTKAALISLARGFAELTKGTSVTCNSVLAGPTWTEGVQEYLGDLAKANGKTTEQQTDDYFTVNEPTSLIQRFCTVKEIADVVVFLASARASAVNGHAQRVEGGIIRSV